jgi:hypothetical protein
MGGETAMFITYEDEFGNHIKYKDFANLLEQKDNIELDEIIKNIKERNENEAISFTK